jgi:hypothetical protein
MVMGFKNLLRSLMKKQNIELAKKKRLNGDYNKQRLMQQRLKVNRKKKVIMKEKNCLLLLEMSKSQFKIAIIIKAQSLPKKVHLL